MNSFLETMRQLGPTRLGIMGAVVVGLMFFFIFISMRISSPEYKLLYSDLESTDAGAVAAKLEELKIPYDISPDGARIRVAEADVGRARMLLAQEGLPNGGSLGYEIFDRKAGFGTTNFVQNLNQLRALEGELARTISSIENVRSARVHLVLPQRELFSRESRMATASVFLNIRAGQRLDNQQILGIQALISSAVPDLKPTNVSIVDQNGALLARGNGDQTDLTTVKADELNRSYEQRLVQSIEDLVSRSVGFGRVRANVSAELNFDRISTNEEFYDPASQVARSTQVVEENNKERESPQSEEVSVENNLPGLGADTSSAGPTSEGNRTEEITNYEISKTVKSTVREVGEIKRLSVAVLVDGTYTTGENGEKIYKPRDQQELDQLSKLVKSAIGYNEKRGDSVEIINMQFADIDTVQDGAADDRLFGFERSDLLDAIEIFTVAIMIILVVLLVLQPMVGKLLAAGEGASAERDMEAELLANMNSPSGILTGPDMSENEQPMEESLIDMQQVEGKVKASSIKKVEDIVDNYPNETVSVLRSWMTQE